MLQLKLAVGQIAVNVIELYALPLTNTRTICLCHTLSLCFSAAE